MDGRRGGSPHPIDAHVGARVKLRRTALGMSQTELGNALGVTFQQVQKYERGANRIGASRLLDIAHVLEVPISFFYEDVSPVRTPPAEGWRADNDILEHPETKQLVAAYYAIADAKIRRQLRSLSKALANCDAEKASKDDTAK
jgi:transcriptional regulator with XRE-family HTH domain